MDDHRQVQVRFQATGEPTTAPLIWGQQSMWKAIQWYGDQSAYFNVATVVELPEGVDLPTVLDVLRRLAETHQGLRTHYLNEPDGPRQRVEPAGTLVVKLRDCAAEQADAAADSLFAELRGRCFDHTREWPIRFGVVEAAGRPCRLVVVVSHVSLDSWSLRLLIARFNALLAGEQADPAHDEVWEPLDEARYQQSPVGVRRSAAALAHWQHTLRVMPRTMFDFTPGAPAQPRFQSLALESAALAVAADRLATAGRISTSSVLLAGTAVTLAALSGRDSIGLQLIVGNRHDQLRQRLAAPTAQNGLFQVHLGDGDFADLARRCYRTGLAAYQHGYYDTQDLDKMIAATGLECGTHHDLTAYFNDIRGGRDRWEAIDGQAVSRAEVERLREHSVEKVIGSWDVQDSKFFLNVDYAPDRCLVSVLTDTAYVPSPMAVLRGLENLLVEAAYRRVGLAEAISLTGLSPAVRGSEWWRVGTGWVRPEAVAEVLRDAAGTPDVAVFRPDDEQLVACVVGSEDPEDLHRRVVGLLDGRTDAIAPHLYHLCQRRPARGDSLDAWLAGGVIRSGSGRGDREGPTR
ncbi:condensation domain-containing protein [Micromonospora rubida]